MDTETAVKNLVGQRVFIDQSHTDPPVLVGILIDMGTGYYTVEDETGLGEVTFDWSEVERIDGHSIMLEDPAALNESPPDDEIRYPHRSPFDDEEGEISGW